MKRNSELLSNKKHLQNRKTIKSVYYQNSSISRNE